MGLDAGIWPVGGPAWSVGESPVLYQLHEAVSDLMAVERIEVLHPPAQVVRFRGRVVGDPKRAFQLLLRRFEALGYTPMLAREGDRDLITAHQGVVRPHPARTWINALLFVATVLTTLYAGAAQQGIDLLREPGRWTTGLPFALTLLVILGTHEFGHYFAARYHRAAVTLPYFIPMPFNFLGTMGAFIQLRSPIKDRKSLFDIGVAGPLAGLAVAIPLLLYGLSISPVGPIGPGLLEGNSLLYLALKYLVHGRVLPGNGLDVWLDPIAFAAWFGLLVTCFNLLPIGQLDGGHIAYALWGRRAWSIASVSVVLLFALSFFWIGWLTWALLVFFLGLRHPPPLNDLTPLDGKRRAVGIATVILFFLVFTPVPLQAVP